MKNNSSRQTPLVGTSTLLSTLLSSHWKQLEVKISKKIQTVRLLMSKYYFSEDNFSDEEKVALFVSWEESVKLCEKDASFKIKHFWYLFLIRTIVQSLNEKIFDSDSRKFYRKQIEPSLSHGRGYFSAQIYFGYKVKLVSLFKVYISTRSPVKAKEKAYVGVGYNDKGNARNESFDGSPHWTEVASSQDEIDNDWRKEEPSSLFDFLKIHSGQRAVNQSALR